MSRFSSVIGILITLALLVPVQAQEDGLVAEWHFDEGSGSVVKDSSGNGNDGTIYGATWVDGKFGKALRFNGVSDYIGNIGGESSYSFIQNTGIFSIEGFFKLDAPYSDKQTLVANNGATAESGFYFALENDHLRLLLLKGITHQPTIDALSPNNVLIDSNWHHYGVTGNGVNIRFYVDGIEYLNSESMSGKGSGSSTRILEIARFTYSKGSLNYFKGVIDEIHIYNRALSAEEIKAHYEQGQTTLTVKKEVSPYSIRQYQTTNVTVQIKNTGTSEIRDIEVADSTNSNLELIGGDFPNPKKYNSLSPGESRDIRYILTSKESGTFILYPATVSYSDSTGNIKVIKSEPISLTVVPSSEGSPEISSPSDIGSSSAVLLHGEKTDVVLGEDILLKLSAVNLITKPPMSVQVMLYPPSGMSVTGSEFVKSGAGIYTTTYSLDPGDGKDIEVHIKSNQVGDFNVKGRIVYYFGEDKHKAEDHTLNLPIKVRKEPGPPAPFDPTPKAPGFAGELAIIGILFVVLLIKRSG